MSLRSVRLLALWSVLCQMPAGEMEAFAAWLWRARQGDAPIEPGLLEPSMRLARKMTTAELAELSDLLVAAIEEQHEAQ